MAVPPLPPLAAVRPPAPAEAAAPARSFAAALAAKSAPPQATPPPARSVALETLRGIEAAQRRLDAVLAAARAGRTFTARELLALQASAYRCAQTVDLAARLVEQGAQTVKHTVNTQV